MIPDYDTKKAYLFEKQHSRCGVTGVLIVPGMKADLHHIWAQRKWRQKLYPHYMNSTWNLLLVINDAHITKALPKPPYEWQIAKAERILSENPGIEYRISMEEALNEL